MRILKIDEDPLQKIGYLNAGRRPNNFFVDQLPIYKATVDELPDDLDAIVVTADLQGRELFPDKKTGVPIRLLGEVLPQQMGPILERLGVNSSKKVGAILAGDFYTFEDLHGRGGTGDVTQVWKEFANEFRWVVGVAGNHDTFSEGEKPFAGPRHIHFLDATRVCVDGIQIAGLSGVIGNPNKNFRRTHQDYLETLELLLDKKPDIALMHEGPDVGLVGFRGLAEIREIIESKKPPLVIRGHKRWPKPLVEIGNSIQILNVEATVVVLVRN